MNSMYLLSPWWGETTEMVMKSFMKWGTNQPTNQPREHEPTNFCQNSAVLLLSPPGDAFSFRRSGQECFSWSVLIGCVPAEHEGKFLETHLLDFPGGTKKSSIIFQGASIYFLLLIIFFGLLFIGIKSLVPWTVGDSIACRVFTITCSAGSTLKHGAIWRKTKNSGGPFFAVRILRWMLVAD